MRSQALDPRSKLFACVVGTGVLMAFDHWSYLATALGGLILATGMLGLLRAWTGLANSLGFGALSFFAIAWLAFDLVTGLAAGLRLLTIGTLFFLFFRTTAPEHLSNALVKMGLPYAFTFVLTISMQFVEVLARRAANIRDAQRARGIPLHGSWSMLRHLHALFGPLLIQAFKLADELAEAMEARGFGTRGRSFRFEPGFRWPDWVVFLGSAAGLIGILWFGLV